MGFGLLAGLGAGLTQAGSNMMEVAKQDRINEWKEKQYQREVEQRATERAEERDYKTRTDSMKAGYALQLQGMEDEKKAAATDSQRQHERGLLDVKHEQDLALLERKAELGYGSSSAKPTARMQEVKYYMQNNPDASFEEAWNKINTNRNDPFVKFVSDAYDAHLKDASERFEEPMPFDQFADAKAKQYEYAVTKRFGSQDQPSPNPAPTPSGFTEAQQERIAQFMDKNPSVKTAAEAAQIIQQKYPSYWPK